MCTFLYLTLRLLSHLCSFKGQHDPYKKKPGNNPMVSNSKANRDGFVCAHLYREKKCMRSNFVSIHSCHPPLMTSDRPVKISKIWPNPFWNIDEYSRAQW